MRCAPYYVFKAIFPTSFLGKDKVGNSDGTGFKVTSLQSLVDTYQGKQVTVTYRAKVVNAARANAAANTITVTSNWLPNITPPPATPATLWLTPCSTTPGIWPTVRKASDQGSFTGSTRTPRAS